MITQTLHFSLLNAYTEFRIPSLWLNRSLGYLDFILIKPSFPLPPVIGVSVYRVLYSYGVSGVQCPLLPPVFASVGHINNNNSRKS